jgi:phospholipid-binding lipoprotein MlaA
MRSFALSASLVSILMLTSCTHKGTNPVDPYEPFNRKVHNFNMAFDATVLRPPAKLYHALVPRRLRKGVGNFFNNLDMLPTVANDILQAEGKMAIRDSWRFAINSTLGVAGLFDIAVKFGLAPHYNDLGVTFAKWGDKNSPYIVIPFIGPSTIRDGSGWLFQFALWSPYVYINNDALAFGLLTVHYIDLRSQLFDAERLMNEALDKYSFIRDAYLQHRNYLIAGAEQDNGSLYIDDAAADDVALQETATLQKDQGPSDYVDE